MVGENKDVLVLVFYIVLTIALILFGKIAGKTLYVAYQSIDPGASTPTDYCTGPECVPKTPAQLAALSIKGAEEEGRYVGAWVGFFVGSALCVFKAYSIYMKIKTGAQ